MSSDDKCSVVGLIKAADTFTVMYAIYFRVLSTRYIGPAKMGA